MIANSNIIRRWDNKWKDSALKHYQDLRSEYKYEIKPHSAFTVLAILATTGPFSLLSSVRFENVYGQHLLVLLMGLQAIICITLYFVAYYHWRVFISLRHAGINTDNNIFFPESAGRYRKVSFYIAVALDSIRMIHSHLNPEDIRQKMRRLKFQLRSEYYHDVGLAILDSIVLSIIFVELARILFPQTFTWSSKKHAAIVIVASLIISTFKIVILYSTSGHGIF